MDYPPHAHIDHRTGAISHRNAYSDSPPRHVGPWGHGDEHHPYSRSGGHNPLYAPIDHRSGISHRSREIDTPPRVVALKRELAGLQSLASSGGEPMMSWQLRRMGELQFDIQRLM